MSHLVILILITMIRVVCLGPRLATSLTSSPTSAPTSSRLTKRITDDYLVDNILSMYIYSFSKTRNGFLESQKEDRFIELYDIIH